MKIKGLIQYSAFAIVAVATLYSYIDVALMPDTLNSQGQTVSYSVSDSTMYSSFIQFIILIFIIKKKEYWKHFFAAFAFLSTIGILQLFSTTITFGFFISFEVYSLGILIIHIGLNPKVLSDLKTLIKPGLDILFPPESDSKPELNAERVAHFKSKFDKKSSSELEHIVTENERIAEACEAAKQLLDERNNAL